VASATPDLQVIGKGSSHFISALGLELITVYRKPAGDTSNTAGAKLP